MKRNRYLYILAIGTLAFVIGVPFGIEWWHTLWANSRAIATKAAIGGPFQLTASDGSTITDRTYRGKIVLIYFGYTYCPDACPTTLNAVAGALAELGPIAEHVQPLFITIDPQRDTREVLADYVKSFDSRIVGLTGTPAELAAAAKSYGVYYAQYRTADAPNGYLMDHTSVVYVMNEEGRFVASFTQETTASQMADRLRKLIAKTS
jgi:protein SCO1/2